ncbi:hypothetical protein P389DRAFT_71468 [Cystobasidium minutum MCA 4210]|uniref:uncharacterized protein n=1 Tax=Cystobasidium minutum MCA 4210 TaxID=1397322 RepID=UPI0034D004AF|eukprot:jgi/Rhomi1/71468/CE71467_663
MKTSSVVFGTIVVAGAGVQAAPFFGVPSDFALSALIGRGLTGDSHKPDSKLLNEDHGNAEQRGGKEVQRDPGATKHDKSKHTDHTLAAAEVKMKTDMDMCANVVVDGVLTQKCNTKSSSKPTKKPNDGKPQENHNHNNNGGGGKASPPKQQPHCDDHLLSLKAQMALLRSDNERYRRKLGEYERKLAFYDEPRDDKNHLVTRGHHSSSEHHRSGSDHHRSSHDDTEGGLSLDQHHASKEYDHHYEDGGHRYHSNSDQPHHKYRDEDSGIISRDYHASHHASSMEAGASVRYDEHSGDTRYHRDHDRGDNSDHHGHHQGDHRDPRTSRDRDYEPFSREFGREGRFLQDDRYIKDHKGGLSHPDDDFHYRDGPKLRELDSDYGNESDYPQSRAYRTFESHHGFFEGNNGQSKAEKGRGGISNTFNRGDRNYKELEDDLRKWYGYEEAVRSSDDRHPPHASEYNHLKGTLKDEGTYFGKDIKKDEKHAQGSLGKEGRRQDQALKKDSSQIDSGTHHGASKIDEGAHNKGTGFDEEAHHKEAKLDKGIHSDANDVDDDMHHDGKKVDYRLHDDGKKAIAYEHDLASGSKQGSAKHKDKPSGPGKGNKDEKEKLI